MLAPSGTSNVNPAPTTGKELTLEELSFLLHLGLAKGIIPQGTVLSPPFRDSILACLNERHQNSVLQLRVGTAVAPRCQSPNYSTIFGFNNFEEFKEFLTKPLTASLSIVRNDASMWRIEKFNPFFMKAGFIECNLEIEFSPTPTPES
jgi:hypothetical protein